MALQSDTPKVLEALANWNATDALATLEESGCDRDELLRLLVRLRKARTTEPWPRKRLEKLATELRSVSDEVAQLVSWGESRNLGLPDDSETWLETRSGELKTLADAISVKATDADGRKNQRLDRAKDRVVQYALGATGRPHDSQVARLVQAVLNDEGYDLENHQKWRMYYSGKTIKPKLP